MDTRELEEKWNQTKGILEQKIARLNDCDHHYINDWTQSSAVNSADLKTCEFCNLNQKLCNTNRL
jgi:hypothetical protein